MVYVYHWYYTQEFQNRYNKWFSIAIDKSRIVATVQGMSVVVDNSLWVKFVRI